MEYESILKTYNLEKPKILFETGLYKGEGVEKSLRHFNTIYSCDIVKEFVDAAKLKFKNEPHVILFHGDSKDCIKSVLNIKDPILFYLDAHYSGGPTGGQEICNGCPVLEELKTIGQRANNKDIIIIDDIRLMGKATFSGTEGDPTYPLTFFNFKHATIENMISAYGRPCNYHFVKTSDRLLLLPK